MRIQARYRHPAGDGDYRQEQLIAERDGYFLWLGFTAPQQDNARFHPVMEQALGSFRFLDRMGN